MPPYERPAPKFKLSPQQEAFIECLTTQSTHIIMEALAGTGKTTTGIEGLRQIPNNKTAAFLAFNKSIAVELQAKVPQGVKAATFHSVGFGAVSSSRFGKLEIDGDRTYKMLPERMPRHAKSTIIRLVSICKNTLCDGRNREELLDLCAQYDIDVYDTKSGASPLTSSDYKPGWNDANDESASMILNAVPDILEKSKTPTGSIDFDDMIWLPVIWNLPMRKFDYLVVDELQDLNKAQRALAFMVGRRIIGIGDKRQAIYGFRGADVKSMDNFADELSATPQSLTVLPLTVTRRCPRLVTALAREIVPTFECPPDAPMGKVCLGTHYLELEPTETAHSYEYKIIRKPYPEVELRAPQTQPDSNSQPQPQTKEPGFCPDEHPQRGDMVLCRTNAPLVQMAYTLIRQNVPCKIQGRDFGRGLEDLIKKLVASNTSTLELLRALNIWASKERSRIEASGVGHETRMSTQLGNLGDKVDCITALTEGVDTTPEVITRIQLLFQDVNKTNGDSSPPNYVLLSSVHRAKGLEAHTVRIIQPELLPHPMARMSWQKEQEMNLKYVAITRSLDTLHMH